MSEEHLSGSLEKKWKWYPIDYYLKTNVFQQRFRKNVELCLEPTIEFSVSAENSHKPSVFLYIDIEKEFQFVQGVGWTWGSSVPLPNISVRMNVKDTEKKEDILLPKNIYCHLFAVKQISEGTKKILEDSLIEGRDRIVMKKGEAFFKDMKIRQEAHSIGSYYHLLILIYIQDKNSPKIFQAALSPPIYVSDQEIQSRIELLAPHIRNSQQLQGKSTNSDSSPCSMEAIESCEDRKPPPIFSILNFVFPFKIMYSKEGLNKLSNQLVDYSNVPQNETQKILLIFQSKLLESMLKLSINQEHREVNRNPLFLIEIPSINAPDQKEEITNFLKSIISKDIEVTSSQSPSGYQELFMGLSEAQKLKIHQNVYPKVHNFFYESLAQGPKSVKPPQPEYKPIDNQQFSKDQSSHSKPQNKKINKTFLQSLLHSNLSMSQWLKHSEQPDNRKNLLTASRGNSNQNNSEYTEKKSENSTKSTKSQDIKQNDNSDNNAIINQSASNESQKSDDQIKNLTKQTQILQVLQSFQLYRKLISQMNNQNHLLMNILANSHKQKSGQTIAKTPEQQQ